MVVAAAAQKSFLGSEVSSKPTRSHTKFSTTVVASKVKKVDINKQGINSVDDEIIRLNLQGKSKTMAKKDWVDSSGRGGKGYGVYKFENKYGANVDGYSPIYTPDIWSEGGDTYKLGAKGLAAWAGLIVVLLGVGITLVVSTSAIGQ